MTFSAAFWSLLLWNPLALWFSRGGPDPLPPLLPLNPRMYKHPKYNSRRKYENMNGKWKLKSTQEHARQALLLQQLKRHVCPGMTYIYLYIWYSGDHVWSLSEVSVFRIKKKKQEKKLTGPFKWVPWTPLWSQLRPQMEPDYSNGE